MECLGIWCLCLAVLVMVVSDTWAQTEGWLWSPPQPDASSGLQPPQDSTPQPKKPHRPQRSQWPQRPQWPHRTEPPQRPQRPQRPPQPKVPPQSQGPQWYTSQGPLQSQGPQWHASQESPQTQPLEPEDPLQTQGPQWPVSQGPPQTQWPGLENPLQSQWPGSQDSQELEDSQETEVYPVPQRPTLPQVLQRTTVPPRITVPQRTTVPQQPQTQQPGPQRPAWPQQPQLPAWPQQPQLPAWPQQPQLPAGTQRPAWPQQPQQPAWPQQPQQPAGTQRPAWPQQPQRPAWPQQPQLPAWPQQPQLPAWPQQPQLPAGPQRPAWPQQPQRLPRPQRPAGPQQPEMPLWHQNSLWPQETEWDEQLSNMVQDSPDYAKCVVDVSRRVTCGLPDITAEKCQAIDCCHDGRKCYYGKAVTVQCTKDGQFVLVIARDSTLPTLDLDSLRLLGGNDAPCSPVAANSAFAIFQFPVTECGTTVTEDDGFVIYENNMLSTYNVAFGTSGSITRDSHFELLFQCRYSTLSVEAVAFEVLPVQPPASVAAMGTLRVQLRLANGHCLTKGCVIAREAFTSFYSEADYPVTKVLREPVYVEVNILGRNDPSLTLMLDHCWATASPSALSLPQWDLLYNGCPYQDDRFLTTLVPVEPSDVLYPSHHKRFILKMFTFVDQNTLIPLKDTMFLHCSVSVCYHTAPGSCVQSCNRKRREVPADQRAESHVTLVSSRKIILQ